MAEKIEDRLIEIIGPLFPSESLVVHSLGADGTLVVSAGWRMGASRMDNWSKEIRVVVSGKILERFSKLNDKGRRKAEANMASFIELHLSKFEPHHDRPRFLLPPVEVWEPTFEEMFPKAGK